MILLEPIPITDSILTSHSVAESELTWDVATGYSQGDERRYGSDHDLFRSKVNSNTGNIPVVYPDETAYWYHIGKTNRYNGFDLKANIQTVGASPMTFVIEPGKVTTAAYFDYFEADNIRIEVSNGVSTVYSNEINGRTRDVLNYYGFGFNEHRFKSSIAFFDLPAGLTSPVITVTMTRSDGDVKLGGFAIGKHYTLGVDDSSGTKYNRLSFSEFGRDDFGNLRLTPRAGASKASVEMIVEANMMDFIVSKLSAVDAQVMVWSSLTEETNAYFRPFNIRGVYRSPIDITQLSETAVRMKFDIEGV